MWALKGGSLPSGSPTRTADDWARAVGQRAGAAKGWIARRLARLRERARRPLAPSGSYAELPRSPSIVQGIAALATRLRAQTLEVADSPRALRRAHAGSAGTRVSRSWW
jgi:hypothetical protein